MGGVACVSTLTQEAKRCGRDRGMRAAVQVHGPCGAGPVGRGACGMVPATTINYWRAVPGARTQERYRDQVQVRGRSDGSGVR